MGILSKLGLGKKGEIPELPKDFGALPALPKLTSSMGTEPGMDNLKAKIDLVMTQLESMTIRYQTLAEKIDRIERMMQEIYTIAKRA